MYNIENNFFKILNQIKNIYIEKKMSSKLSLLTLILTLSFITSINKIDVPYDLKFNTYMATFQNKLGGSNSVDFILSLTSPVSILQNNGAYDTSSKTPLDKTIKLNYYGLGKKISLEENLYEDKFEISTSSSDKLSIDKMQFIISSLDQNIESSFGILGLAPGIDTTNSKEIESDSCSLKILGKSIDKSVFSVSNFQKQLDGSFKGNISLGYLSTDFQTGDGQSVKCKNKNKNYWACDFKYLKYNNTNMNFDAGDIVLSSEKPFAVFNIEYLDKFAKLFPEGLCKKKEKYNTYVLECDGVGLNELELVINIENNYDLKIIIPDFANILDEDKYNHIFTPGIYFTSDLTGAYIPIHWFRNYQILFNRENTNSPYVQFHTYDESLITSNEEKEKQKNEKNYISISKTAFVLLCIALGIVFVVLILFIGYIKLVNSKTKPTHGLKSTRTVKGKGTFRVPTFDSALLGTSDDSMPKRYKTDYVAFKY